MTTTDDPPLPHPVNKNPAKAKPQKKALARRPLAKNRDMAGHFAFVAGGVSSVFGLVARLIFLAWRPLTREWIRLVKPRHQKRRIRGDGHWRRSLRAA